VRIPTFSFKNEAISMVGSSIALLLIGVFLLGVAWLWR
jgi:hypothetical protein